MQLEMLGENGSLGSDFDWNNLINRLIGGATDVATAAVSPSKVTTIINDSTTTLEEKLKALAATQLTDAEKAELVAQSKNDYTPWIIGGSVVAGLLILALVMKR